VSRARLFLPLMLSLAAVLFGGPSLAGLPEHVAERTLAPVHAFEPDAARGEVGQVRRAVAGARGEPGAAPPPGSKPPPGKTVHNAYLMPSPGSAIEKMSSRLAGKEPLVLSATQFEKNGAVLPKAPAAPPAGKVTSRVFEGKGLIEIQLPSHTELMTLELRPGVAVDNAQLQKSIGEARQQLFQGPRRPDRIQQMPNGTFKIYSGSVQIVDPRADRLRPRTDRRIVMKTPRRRRAL
jgi:hypothetical protein